ncbi:acyl-CoA dehydrogenase family protein [Gulosibacter molinativorax]|uniref:Acyl-CoA dehydrogenase n=1 Tax=Gulosibacter molinativorax TaxID=256821 RepID=A0ABT7C752_9MICO|nr:acyl-CoA dehydrogenase family protein [Gulosibacter molinativorax]MDJ1371000.1 acyl-CoA dehydrogenase [Gulosibacter molinativorax]QUY62794.1 Acyl-CoA dehydrogenase [Gulosibacter molinativorax]
MSVTTITSNPADYYHVWDQLSDADRDVVNRVRAFTTDHALPVVGEAWERADFPYELIPELRKVGIVGTAIKGYGAPGLTRLQAGLVAMELSRCDGSLNTFNAVHSGLAMGSINILGSDEQKERWLPKMANLDLLGAFALTEPDHGSDTVALETSARIEGDEVILNGAKKWIGLGHVADLVIVWARREDTGKVAAFVVEKDPETGNYPEGYEAEAITGKIAKRGIQQAEITLTDVRVPLANALAEAVGFRSVSRVLNTTRATVAWEALGHAQAAYDIAVQYTQERAQFGKPIASYQLVQRQLALMLADLTAMQLMCFRSAQLQDAGELSNDQASLLKMFCSDKGRDICRQSRDLLGGNGLLLENQVARHLTDMEVVHTYEGTDFIQSLIVGREITGINAIS